MRWLENWLFPLMWSAFLLYWQIMAVKVKATQRLEPVSSRVVRVILFGTAIILLWDPAIPLRWLYWHFMPSGYWLF